MTIDLAQPSALIRANETEVRTRLEHCEPGAVVHAVGRGVAGARIGECVGRPAVDRSRGGSATRS